MVDEVVKFFVSREHHWSIRASVLTFIAVFFCLTELTTGLVSMFINSQRVDLLLKLDSAIRSSTLDKPSIEFFMATKQALLKRGPFPSFTFSDMAVQFRATFQEVNFQFVLFFGAGTVLYAYELFSHLYKMTVKLDGMTFVAIIRETIETLLGAAIFCFVVMYVLVLINRNLSVGLSYALAIVVTFWGIWKFYSSNILKKVYVITYKAILKR